MGDHKRTSRTRAELDAWQARKGRTRRGWPLLDAGDGRRVSLTGRIYTTQPDGSLRRIKLDAA